MADVGSNDLKTLRISQDRWGLVALWTPVLPSLVNSLIWKPLLPEVIQNWHGHLYNKL